MIDARIGTFSSLEIVFQCIEQNCYFLLEDTDWINHAWSQQACIHIMKATDNEMNERQLCAGLSGFNNITEWYLEQMVWLWYNEKYVIGKHFVNSQIIDVMNSRTCSSNLGYWHD